MSFIYKDEKLMSELFKSAIEFNRKFNKHAQDVAPDPSFNVELKNYLSLSNKLVDQLQQVYFPTTPDVADVTTGTGQQANLGVPELSSLGNFLDYIINNQIMVNGKRVAYGSGENPDPKVYLPVTANQIKFMMETVTPQGDRTQFQADYNVSRDYLIAYINSLLAEAAQRDEQSQRFIKVMLGARINDVNRLFHTNLTTDYKAPEKVLPDTTVLDNVPKDMDPKMPANPGNVPVTVGNLKSAMTFNGWLSDKSISIKIGDRQMMINHPEFDRCAVLQILAVRAKYNGDRAATEQQAQYATLYMQKVQAIAASINCDLGTPQGQQGGQAGGGGDLSPQILQQLAEFLPFNSQNVNFNDIKIFVDKYAQLSRRSDIVAQARQVNSSIGEAQTYMKAASMIVPLEQMRSSADLGSWHAFAKDARLADTLYTIVNTAGLMYTDFVNIAKNKLDQGTVTKISQQVDDGGPWSVNMDDINQFRTDLREEALRGGR